jgi:hypothetical protein
MGLRHLVSECKNLSGEPGGLFMFALRSMVVAKQKKSNVNQKS